MKVMYPASKTRFDFLFAASALATRSSLPRKSDAECLNRLYKYIRATKDFKMKILCKEMVLKASVDASYNLHPDCKGHTGLVILIGDCPIFAKSNKQRSVATSSMHAEVIALFDSIPFVTWLRDLLGELGYPQENPTIIEQDNQSAIQVYSEGVMKSSKTRHLSNKCAYISEMIQEKVIIPKYVQTDLILADVLTKPVTGTRFKDCFRRYVEFPSRSRKGANITSRAEN